MAWAWPSKSCGVWGRLIVSDFSASLFDWCSSSSRADRRSYSWLLNGSDQVDFQPGQRGLLPQGRSNFRIFNGSEPFQLLAPPGLSYRNRAILILNFGHNEFLSCLPHPAEFNRAKSPVVPDRFIFFRDYLQKN